MSTFMDRVETQVYYDVICQLEPTTLAMIVAEIEARKSSPACLIKFMEIAYSHGSQAVGDQPFALLVIDAKECK